MRHHIFCKFYLRCRKHSFEWNRTHKPGLHWRKTIFYKWDNCRCRGHHKSNIPHDTPKLFQTSHCSDSPISHCCCSPVAKSYWTVDSLKLGNPGCRSCLIVGSAIWILILTKWRRIRSCTIKEDLWTICCFGKTGLLFKSCCQSNWSLLKEYPQNYLL
jgi:hypothetical protein